MFDAFFNAIAWLLAWFYELPVLGNNYAVAIGMLTLAIMVLVTPLNVKATRSMMTMSAMAPEMKKIQEEFADDRQRMNEELLNFYRENKINPLGSCLPMLMQFPFFIVLYQVIYGLTRRASETMTAANGEMVEAGQFIPKYLDQFPESTLYGDLVGSESMYAFGLDLSRSAAAALQVSFTTGIPYMVLIIAVAGTAFLQQKQMSLRNPNAEMPTQQKILLRVLPVFFAAISFNFAAGLVVYFFVSNVYRIFQNAAISMRLYGIGGVQALLGIGVASLPGATSPSSGGDDKNGKTDKGKASPAKDANPGGTSGKGRTNKSPGSPNGRSNGRSDGKDTPKKNVPKKGQPSGDKPARPPSGRVTPPKKAAGGGSTPPRRKKKRS